MSPSPDKITAIQKINAPTNVTDLRRILTIINFVGGFIPKLDILQGLLKTDTIWSWGNHRKMLLQK